MKGTGRIEAFSDGVMAIIITIMVLGIKIPEEVTIEALWQLAPQLLGYLLSFIYAGIYWNNHHHLFQATTHINGKVLWANLHLLFWLSLIPLTTGWMGQNYTAALPTAFYGVVLLLSAFAWWLLQRSILSSSQENQLLATAIKNGSKEKISLILYLLGISFSFINTWIADLFYAITALLWLIPDRRIERVFETDDDAL